MIDMFSEHLVQPSLGHNIQKMFVANEYQKLKEVIEKDDMGHILKKVENFDLPNVMPIGDSEQLLINASAELIPIVTDSKYKIERI